MADKRETMMLLGILFSAYPNLTVKPETIQVYTMALADLPDDILRAAIMKAIGSPREFCPPPGVVRQYAVEISLNVDHIPSEGEAWEEAKREVARTTDVSERYFDEDGIGGAWYVRHVDLPGEYSHPLIGKCVEIVGRENIPGDLEGVNRSHFCKVYLTLLHRAVEDAGMLPEVRAVTERYALGAGEQPSLVSGQMDALAGRLDARNAAMNRGRGER